MSARHVPTPEEREKVLQAVIRPMLEFYRPPSGTDEADQRRILDRYISLLCKYSASVLSDAWVDVESRHEQWTWPLPATILRSIARVRAGGYL